MEKKNEQTQYEDWLTCIANTRLLFNTIDELEAFLDAPSIHNNGIKRCFTTLQRMRAAFRDLAGDIYKRTNDTLNLEVIMLQYQKAWNFYKENLSRRVDPSAVAMELLDFHYPPYKKDNLSKKKTVIFNQIEENDISIPFLLLMLLKAMPGYDSKNGENTNFKLAFSNVLDFLEKFTNNCDVFSTLPVLIAAREEPDKSRIMLLYHTINILETYKSFSEQTNFYNASSEMKLNCVNLNIEGYWNECDGKLTDTSFWHIENALRPGSYFITHWKKDADNNLNGIRYTLFLEEDAGNSLIAYILHPSAIKHRMNGIAYTDCDHVWYRTLMPKTDTPDNLPFNRLMASSVWQKSLNLTKIKEQKTLDIYQKWIDTCHIVKMFKNMEYVFYPSLYAITRDHLYIPTGTDKDYYQIPKDSFEGFEQITINDNVGTMIMDNKQYLVFDEFLLYIPITKNNLKKYGIKIIDHIE